MKDQPRQSWEFVNTCRTAVTCRFFVVDAVQHDFGALHPQNRQDLSSANLGEVRSDLYAARCA